MIKKMSISTSITIDGTVISKKEPPYIIAEISANHNGSIDNAIQLIEIAQKSGASAVKLQTYTADTITLKSTKSDFMISDGLWSGQTLYDLYQSAYTPWEWHEELFKKARDLNITLFSSPFDTTAVDFLEDLNTPAYKIASFEAIDLPLIRYVASTGKPIIISTGMADENEIAEAIETARTNGCKQLAILHCVSAYPAAPEEYNLHTLADMGKRFNIVTGLSDHTLDNTTAITSVALGAAIIEKHVTLDRSAGGPDDSFSLEPSELFALCRDSKTAWSALGKVDYSCKSSEKSNIQFRRSLYFIRDLKSGEIISEKNIKSIRPGYGLAPKYLDQLIGKKVIHDIEAGTPLSWDIIQ